MGTEANGDDTATRIMTEGHAGTAHTDIAGDLHQGVAHAHDRLTRDRAMTMTAESAAIDLEETVNTARRALGHPGGDAITTTAKTVASPTPAHAGQGRPTQDRARLTNGRDTMVVEARGERRPHMNAAVVATPTANPINHRQRMRRRRTRAMTAQPNSPP